VGRARPSCSGGETFRGSRSAATPRRGNREKSHSRVCVALAALHQLDGNRSARRRSP
jgi:hypothetical protein